MNASPGPQPVPAPPAPGRGAGDRRLSHHERFPSSGEQAKQRKHATPSRAPRGGTRYGGADIGRERILKTHPISGTVLREGEGGGGRIGRTYREGCRCVRLAW